MLSASRCSICVTFRSITVRLKCLQKKAIKTSNSRSVQAPTFLHRYCPAERRSKSSNQSGSPMKSKPSIWLQLSSITKNNHSLRRFFHFFGACPASWDKLIVFLYRAEEEALGLKCRDDICQPRISISSEVAKVDITSNGSIGSRSLSCFVQTPFKCRAKRGRVSI